MSKKITTWRPDTCECEIEYEWDSAVKQEDRIHTVSRIVKACEAHKGLTDKVENYDTVVDENTRKNILYGKILEIAGVTQDVPQPDGTTATQLKQGLDYKWSFNDKRALEVELIGFTTAQKNAVTIIANNQFGQKVVIK